MAVRVICDGPRCNQFRELELRGSTPQPLTGDWFTLVADKEAWQFCGLQCLSEWVDMWTAQMAAEEGE